MQLPHIAAFQGSYVSMLRERLTHSLPYSEFLELKGEGIWYWINKGVGWLGGLWFAMIIIAISAFIIIRIRICEKLHSDTYNHR